MKRLRTNEFDRLRRSQYVGTADNLPAPFPGMWPTRIAWRFLGIDIDRSYTGKPSRQAALEFMALQSVPVIRSWFVEFDRKHTPLYHWTNAGTYWVHPILWGVYHHWQVYGTRGEHFTVPLFRKRLDGLVVYSPYRALSLERKTAWSSFMRQYTAYRPGAKP